MKSKKHPRTPKETNELVRIILSHLPAVIKAIALLVMTVVGPARVRPVIQEFALTVQTLRLMSKCNP